MKTTLLTALLGTVISGWAAAPESPNLQAPATTGEPMLAGAPLIAHWTFNEPESSLTIRDASRPGGLDAQANRAIPRCRGIHSGALNLRGDHALRASLATLGPELAGITFCAWTRPATLSGFREIFRQECDRRLLFSFQDGGDHLTLGLNIGGYLECDARIDPARVVDGRWHHCAATFDGEWMRVYLDGAEVGSLQRPGRISLQNDAPGFIGSSGGGGEFFQGSLDDLRIYAQALTPGQIGVLHQSGAEAAQRLAVELEQAVTQYFVPGNTFAESLAATRKKIAQKSSGLEADLAGIIQARLKSRFPEDHDHFTQWAGINLADYLGSAEAGLDVRLAGRLMDLALEYKPLTEQQWKKQTEEERRQWARMDALKARFDQMAANAASSQFSPAWIQLVLEAGGQIQFRPVQNEPVAPYLKPATPPLHRLSATEGRAQLEEDWLHQARHQLTYERITQEIQWARELANRLQSASGRPVDCAGERGVLDTAEKQAAARSVPERELYFQVRQAKRGIMLKNPAVDFERILLVDMPFPQGSEWQHETRHRLGYMAVPGGRLLVLEGLRPDAPVRQLMPQEPLHGSFWRPDVSWDATKALFCFKPHNEKAFHLYEAGLDGSGLVQLTDGPYDDLDPIYLPDDRHIAFSTTRGHTYVRCMPPTSAFVLARCDRAGRDIYLISANNEPDYLPSVMNDGRLVYTRWEYTDKPLWRAQKLWTVNPDGTQVSTLWGNQSVWPDVVKDARSIPGSRRVMFTGSAHHNWFSGAVGILDPSQGFNFPKGIAKVTAELPWPECGNGPVDPVESPRYHASGAYAAYYSPYPLSERDFLVSAQRDGKFVLYLMDVEGNRELIYEGANQVLHAMPVKPRARPPVMPDRVAWPTRQEPHTQPGVFYSSSIYQGAPEALRGQAKSLRIFSIDHKTYTYWYKRPYISTGPVISAVQSEGVKRLLGTVPIAGDGSVSFKAPTGVALHFQLLDGQQRALQTMRSFVNLMPGESRGCLGCHESHSRTPDTQHKSYTLARQPAEIQPPPWADNTVSYPRYVQPVLDKYCGKCHQGEGEARKVFDLVERPSSPIFTEPYLTLIGRPTWGAPYEMPAKPAPGFGLAGCLLVEAYSTTDPKAYVTPPPMTSLSYRSKLIDLVSNGQHYGVKVDEISRQRLIVWVDAMCPYLGDDEVRQIPDPVFQGVDWLSVRPKIASAPHINRPGPVD